MPSYTASSIRFLTSRQQAFIASLVAERPAVADSSLVARAAAGSLTSREASTLIDTLMNSPRPNSPAVRARSGEPIAAPVQTLRAGRMLAAGGVEATVTLPSGQHVTIRINSRRVSGRGWANCSPTESGARTDIKVLGRKVGWLNVSEAGAWTATLIGRDEVKDAVRVLLGFCADRDTPMGYRIQTADRCGRCMRTLTDPVSIDRGIGPECFGRDTGSRHATVAEPTTTEVAAVTATIIAEGVAEVGSAARVTERSLADLAAAFRTDAGQLAGLARQAEARSDAEFAARERAQEAAAYDREAAEERAMQAEWSASVAPVAAAPIPAGTTRARDLIAEALDAYCSDADRDFAMAIFDQLAAR